MVVAVAADGGISPTIQFPHVDSNKDSLSYRPCLFLGLLSTNRKRSNHRILNALRSRLVRLIAPKVHPVWGFSGLGFC